MAMVAITQPGRLENAVASLWSAYLGVLATLKLEFARTTALALGMAQTIDKPVKRVLAPIFTHLLGGDLAHWVDTIINAIISVAAVAVAWFFQQVISMYYSALRGGRMFALGLFGLINENGIDKKMPDSIAKWFDPDNSYLDEILGYSLAAFGCYVQLTSFFQIVFPLNIILFPLTVVEWFLRIQISIGSPSGGMA